jgi:hypothetical protein
MVKRSGRFRVYRVVESVPHVNLQDVETNRLYTVYQSGYGRLQAAVSDLQTGDLVKATLAGDPENDEEAWRLTAVDRVDGVTMDFAVGVRPPDVAREAWEPGTTMPVCVTLTEGETPVGACCAQPRGPLPSGGFVPNVLTGLLPLEPSFESVPGVGAPAVEALFLDPDEPGTGSYTEPYGVVVFFTDAAETTPDRFRDRYDLPRGEDNRPTFDPYAI